MLQVRAVGWGGANIGCEAVQARLGTQCEMALPGGAGREVVQARAYTLSLPQATEWPPPTMAALIAAM